MAHLGLGRSRFQVGTAPQLAQGEAQAPEKASHDPMFGLGMTTAGRKRKPEVLTKQLEEEIRGSPTQDQKIRPLCNGQSARTDALKSALNVLPTAIVDQQK